MATIHTSHFSPTSQNYLSKSPPKRSPALATQSHPHVIYLRPCSSANLNHVRALTNPGPTVSPFLLSANLHQPPRNLAFKQSNQSCPPCLSPYQHKQPSPKKQDSTLHQPAPLPSTQPPLSLPCSHNPTTCHPVLYRRSTLNYELSHLVLGLALSHSTISTLLPYEPHTICLNSTSEPTSLPPTTLLCIVARFLPSRTSLE